MVFAARFGDRHPIVGRDREQAHLRELLDAAIGVHGSLALISGEAGIGKTTLVRDLIQQAGQQDALVLSGGCYDLTATPPYGPWSEAIRGYAPRDDQPSTPAWFEDSNAMARVGSQTALFEETRRFFAAIAEQQPLVIVLEDFHWADTASLEALRYLARTLDETAILLIVTYRDDELTRRHELYQLLPLLIRESRAERVHLNRIDRDDIREMIADRYVLEDADLASLVEHIAQRSEGNPFFAEEILQGLEDDQILDQTDNGWTLGSLERVQMPSLLAQTFSVRLSRLSDNTRLALSIAAVVGHVIPIDLWQEVSGLDEVEVERAMTEAIEARVLEEAPSSTNLQFRHALLREALYESLTLSRRRFWHRKLGETRSEIPNASPDVVAHHFQEAGDPRAAHWLIQAGRRAERSYALRVAAGHYARAQALLEAEPNMAQARGWLLLHIGHLLRYSDVERGIAYLEDATEVARQVNDPLLKAYSQHYHGLLLCFLAEIGRGLSRMEDANAIMESATAAQTERARQAIQSIFSNEMISNPLASPGGGAPFKVGSLSGINTLLHTYILWLAHSGRFQDATRLGKAFVDQVAAATDDALLIQDMCRDAYYGLSVAAHRLGLPDEASRWRTLALDAYQSIGHHVLVRYVHHEELERLLAYHTDRVAARRHAGAAASTKIEGSGTWSDVLVDLLEGRWETAREIARASSGEQDLESRYLRLWVHNVLGHEWEDEEFTIVVRADIQDLLPQGSVTAPGPEQRSGMRQAVPAFQVAASLALDAGQFDRARDWITGLERWLDWSSAVLGRAEAELLWSRHQRLAGDADRARRHALQALDRANDPRQPLALIAAHRLLGEIDTEAGAHDEATEHLRASLDLAQRCAAPYEQALTLLALAELAVARTDPQEATRLLREARAICEDLGATRSLKRADEIAARLRRHTTDHPAGLSDREVEVLEQAATGKTNAEIGEALYISPRTVAQHLRSVYNKLGVNSRAAAVARWAELNSG